MHDIQNHADTREIAIDKVGVCNLRYPISVVSLCCQRQATTAAISMSVNLPHHFKGTHMSRFIEVLNRHRGEVTMRTLPQILHELREKLDAESAHIEVRFPYFVERSAPVTESKALMDYECFLVGESDGVNDD